MPPVDVLHLIAVHDMALRLKALIEAHWEAKEPEGAPYDSNDLNLWAQALGWFE